MNRFILMPTLVLVASVISGGGLIDAAEVATLVNRTRYNVQLYLKWSHVNRESTLITLKPGQNIRQTGPDGTVLQIRFNANPGGPTRESRHRVLTQRTYPDRPGFVSYFRESKNGIVLSSK